MDDTIYNIRLSTDSRQKQTYDTFEVTDVKVQGLVIRLEYDTKWRLNSAKGTTMMLFSLLYYEGDSHSLFKIRFRKYACMLFHGYQLHILKTRFKNILWLFSSKNGRS